MEMGAVTMTSIEPARASSTARTTAAWLAAPPAAEAVPTGACPFAAPVSSRTHVATGFEPHPERALRAPKSGDVADDDDPAP